MVGKARVHAADEVFRKDNAAIGEYWVTYTVRACRPACEVVRFLSTLAAQEASLPDIQQRRDMDDDHRELVRRLFVAAAEVTETAHEAAIAGQSETLTARDCAGAAQRLLGVARDIAALAEAATVVAGLGKDGAPRQSGIAP